MKVKGDTVVVGGDRENSYSQAVFMYVKNRKMQNKAQCLSGTSLLFKNYTSNELYLLCTRLL